MDEQPRVIAFVNTKGGVGKTTSTIGTAYALHQLGYKVEIRDLDPQGSATLWAVNAAKNGNPLPFPVNVANSVTVGIPTTDEETWVLIDTPPSQVGLINAALEACSIAILVSTPGPLDLERLDQTTQTINRPSSALLTQVRGNTISLSQAEEYLRDHGIGKFKTIIPYREKIKRASVDGKWPSNTGYGEVAYEILEAWGLRDADN